ncbi:MAG: putative nucleic-acid-binding protein [Myxococcota bacterium]
MKAVDTNVLVRVLTRDDPEQASVAAAEMRAGPIHVSVTVLLETEWVLRHAYAFDRDQVGRALAGVVDLAGATIDDESAVRAALRWHARGMDLADALHVARLHPGTEFITFDKRLARRATELAVNPRVRLLE